MNGGGGGGGMGTLQALLTELSGLKKPRGFVNRVVRRALGMRPKPPPKYRLLVMMATNMPSALDEALLRPGRIDRIYRVGYPSKAGRIRTYEGYFAKVANELTAEQLDKLATITPYATGATIKDLVNEALITAIRDGRDVITWPDVIKAKQLKELGPPEDVEYIERERHAVAIHEACHAVVAYRTRQHMEIDIATIEKGSDYLGMVASVKPEDQFTRWRTEYEADILVSLASLAGERMFFDSDSSSGVSGDLESATTVASYMEGFWGMGTTVSSYSSARRLEVGSPGGGRPGANTESSSMRARHALADRIEDNLGTLLTQAEGILRENERYVLALAHALETHKTLSGEDVTAVFDGGRGPLVDGSPYVDDEFIARLREYHLAAQRAHREHNQPQMPMPMPVAAPAWVNGVLLADGYGATANGAANGVTDGTADGAANGTPNGTADSTGNGTGTASGTPNGTGATGHRTDRTARRPTSRRCTVRRTDRWAGKPDRARATSRAARGQPGQRLHGGGPGRGPRGPRPAGPDRGRVAGRHWLPVACAGGSGFHPGQRDRDPPGLAPRGYHAVPPRGTAHDAVRLVRRDLDAAAVLRRGGRFLGAVRRLRRVERVRAAGRTGRRGLCRSAPAPYLDTPPSSRSR